MQRYTHVKNESIAVPVHYTRDPLWWLGLFLMACGEIGNFSAYGFAPASLVAPLGTTTVVGKEFICSTCKKNKYGRHYCESTVVCGHQFFMD